MAADSLAQEEEISVLDSIYGDNLVVEPAGNCLKVYIPDKEASQRLTLHIQLPTTYPSSNAPIIDIEAGFMSKAWLQDTTEELLKIFECGEVVIFKWVEWLRERYDEWQESDAACSAAQQACNDITTSDAGHVDDVLVDVVAPRIVHGTPLMERKSTFQAHACKVNAIEEVYAVMTCLLRNNKISNATHNIMAYRVRAHHPSSTILQDYDDDGENAAGSRLLHLLQVADAMDVVVVVSRWFGGVLMGPSRFTLINNTARNLLVEMGVITDK